MSEALYFQKLLYDIRYLMGFVRRGYFQFLQQVHQRLLRHGVLPVLPGVGAGFPSHFGRHASHFPTAGAPVPDL